MRRLLHQLRMTATRTHSSNLARNVTGSLDSSSRRRPQVPSRSRLVRNLQVELQHRSRLASNSSTPRHLPSSSRRHQQRPTKHRNRSNRRHSSKTRSCRARRSKAVVQRGNHPQQPSSRAGGRSGRRTSCNRPKHKSKTRSLLPQHPCSRHQ
ncbi:hypothetical protein COO60DRAFT_1522364 [Scenedesmus sp. NREL 46B-D3]|nr:hypothetical protein COO60DRAFT_1522364 [Scenedesmus sp. NREL 46B-D3]